MARLHLQLSAAKLAVASARKNSGVHVLFITDCFPMPNLFGCKHMVKREENVWLYEPDVRSLKEKLRLPIGSCELAVPFSAKGDLLALLGIYLIYCYRSEDLQGLHTLICHGRNFRCIE